MSPARGGLQSRGRNSGPDVPTTEGLHAELQGCADREGIEVLEDLAPPEERLAFLAEGIRETSKDQALPRLPRAPLGHGQGLGVLPERVELERDQP